MSNLQHSILKNPSQLKNVADSKPLDKKALKLMKKEEKKLQKAKEKLEKSQQRFRDYLTREKAFGEVSRNRGWVDWEKWWRQVGVDGLREDLEILAQSVNCFMDRSDHAVETVREHRKHASEQHLRMFQRHFEMIDRIESKFKT